MSPDSTAEEICETVVFEDVTVDPDAVLEAFGAESPEAIAADAESAESRTETESDRSAAAELDAIDAVTDELVADLVETADDPRSPPEWEESDGDAPEIVVTWPQVADEGGGDGLESIVDDRDVEPSREDSGDDLRLVGPGPDRQRVGNDAFGSDVRSGTSVGLVGGSTHVERV